MRASALALVAVLVSLVLIADTGTTAQQTVVVRGRATIDVPVPTRRATSAYPSRSIARTELAARSELRNVVVFLRDAPARAMTPTRVEIRQHAEQFLPRVVAVPVGSQVAFPNDDPFFHNVFSLARARTFNLGRFPKGQSRNVRFDKPGTVKVFCDIHSHMSATVMVFDHPWFATPDEDGRFKIADVPLGDHQITAWHERLGDTTIRMRIEAGHTASLEFVLPVSR